MRTLIPVFALLLLAALPARNAAADETPAAEARPEAAAPAGQDKPAPAPARSVEEQLAALRPMLVGKRYMNQVRRSLAVQLARMGREIDNPGPWYEDNSLVVNDFLADVQIAYSLEFKEGAQLVSHGMMKSWGMDVERLHQRALANLDRAHGGIAVKQVGKLPWLNVIETQDGYAASRVLLHWRWAELTLTLGEALILGMPTRDVVVFTSNLEPAKIDQLRETVLTVERYQGRPVSRRLFQWTPQGWQEYEGQPGDGTLQQPEQQRGEQGQQQRGAEGKVVEAPAKAEADVAGQAADAQQGGQPRQEDAGNQNRDQQGDQPLQHRH